MIGRHLLAIALVAAVATPALAHITLEQREAQVGASYKAVFKVPHGCDGSATVRLRVRIPDGVISVKPMAKPGWKIDITRGDYAKPYSYMHGAKLTQGVTQINWSGGSLPDALYDEFVVATFLAGELPAGGMVYFPVDQECEKGAHHWVAVPVDGKPTEDDPAPGVKLLPRQSGHGE